MVAAWLVLLTRITVWQYDFELVPSLITTAATVQARVEATFAAHVTRKPRSRISAFVSTSRPRNSRNAISGETELPTLMI